MSGPVERDRDGQGRPRSARSRDRLGKPTDRRDDAGVVDDPALPPEEALRRAQSLLDDGRPFDAHEVLEAVWKASAGSERELWRALAQLAVGITHAERGNPKGARTLLERASGNLAGFGGQSPYGVDVAGIRRWIASAVADLSRCNTPPQLTQPIRPTVR